MHAGLLAVKHLQRAKGRLAPDLEAAERAEVARALFDDALDLCTATGDLLRWFVVSDDDLVLETAGARSLGAVRDSGRGLNPAVVVGLDRLRSEGASAVLVLPSDIPLATPEDVHDLLDTGATSDVVLVPSEGDGGTNGLYLASLDALEPRFGPGSLAAHMNAATEAGLRCSILARERLSLDIDTIDDVDDYLRLSAGASSRTRAVLERLRPAR